MADKGYYGREFEAELADAGNTLIRPARKSEKPREDARFLRPLRQRGESVFDTLKGQLGLERHGGRTPAGVIVKVLQRLLALTAALAQPPDRAARAAVVDRVRSLNHRESII